MHVLLFRLLYLFLMVHASYVALLIALFSAFCHLSFFLNRAKQADSVAVLQDGKVVETGTYAELMSKEGRLLVNLMEGGGN